MISAMCGTQGKNYLILLLSDFFFMCFRVPDSWTLGPSLNLKRAFGYFAFLPDTMCKKLKLFIFGGLDPTTSKPVLETETFDEEEGSWIIHKSLPAIDGHVYQNGADSGCLTSINGTLYSVGRDIISVEWSDLRIHILTKLVASAQGEGCVYLTLETGDFGFFFLSSDWFSLQYLLWTRFDKPDPAFNIVRWKNRPTILGRANLDQECLSPNCRSLNGDRKVFQLNTKKNSWIAVGRLKNARLGYTSAVEVPGNVCDLLEYGDNLEVVEKMISTKMLPLNFHYTEHITFVDNSSDQSEYSDIIGDSTKHHEQITHKDIMNEKSKNLYTVSLARTLFDRSNSLIVSMCLEFFITKIS